MNITKDLVIIGGGPAGMAAAISAKENGIDDLVILERDKFLGGILNQCIHTGFGLNTFNEELTGPEYATRYADTVEELGIEYLTETMVLSVSPNRTVTAVSKTKGYLNIKAGAIILATGCRERTRGAINIPGSRPAGIFTAGIAQYYINILGESIGKNVVILGSGDIGLIIARRLTLEGANVKMVLELMPYSNGLARNISQCLEDFDIPLLLSHTVVGIDGKERLKGVTIAKVDDKLSPIPGTEEYVECDALLLSVGLIPENEIALGAGIEIDPRTNGAIVNEDLETNISGIFACGNALHVHDLVDNVSAEAARAGKMAVKFVKEAVKRSRAKEITAKNGVRYCVPQRICDLTPETSIYFRVTSPSQNKYVVIYADGQLVYKKKKLYLAPSEMESISLNQDICDKINGASEISLELE